MCITATQIISIIVRPAARRHTTLIHHPDSKPSHYLNLATTALAGSHHPTIALPGCILSVAAILLVYPRSLFGVRRFWSRNKVAVGNRGVSLDQRTSYQRSQPALTL